MIDVTPSVLSRLMDVIENDIVPCTQNGVAKGNKIFGAALLKKADLSLVHVDTNNETANPLWHGETHCLKTFYERATSERPETSDLIFLSTHEPCSLCLSAITWASFDNFFYFFSHEDSRDAFSIPHDLNILQEVFGLAPGGYNASNSFWTSWSIRREIMGMPEHAQGQLKHQAARIDKKYEDLSAIYQGSKFGNQIPLS